LEGFSGRLLIEEGERKEGREKDVTPRNHWVVF